MARPKTKGPMIPVRLSLDAYANAEKRAEAKGVTVREYVEHGLELYLRDSNVTATVSYTAGGPWPKMERSTEVEPRFKGKK